MYAVGDVRLGFIVASSFSESLIDELEKSLFTANLNDEGSERDCINLRQGSSF